MLKVLAPALKIACQQTGPRPGIPGLGFFLGDLSNDLLKAVVPNLSPAVKNRGEGRVISSAPECHPVDEALRRERLPDESPWPAERLAEASSIRNSARPAWYLAAARVASEPCMIGCPSLVQRHHLHARPRRLRWISKSGNWYGIPGVPLTALSLQQAPGSSVHEKGFESSDCWI